MNLNLNDEQLGLIVQKAILDSMTPESREAMVSAAVASLLAKPVNPGQYGEKRSVLQAAFDGAVRATAEKLVRDQLATDEAFTAQVKQLFTDVSDRLFTGEKREELVGKLADQMARALSGDRY